MLDLGSGHGGGTHAMVQKFGCKVTVRAAERCLRVRYAAHAPAGAS